MKSFATKRNPKTNRNENKCCTFIAVVSWLIIGLWIVFLCYYWKTDSESFQSKVAAVGGFINKTEHVLRGKIHIGIHTSQYPSILMENKDRLEIAVKTVVESESKIMTHSDINPTPVSKAEIHVVFSTDCTPFQDYQTLVVFHSAKAVGQLGPITRIASGCSEEKKHVLIDLYHKLHPEYFVHFTPDFKLDKKTNKQYDFYNKPFGLLHWLENSVPPIPGDVVVALIDPDFIFLRPLTTKIVGESNLLFSNINSASNLFEKVDKGNAVAQQYGLGAPWARNGGHPKFNREAICGANSPCLLENEGYASEHYSVGPPYLVQKDDLHRLANTWTTFVPRVYEGYPDLLAEMYAYSMAASHEKLPHLQLDHYMVSNIDASGEGWQWIDVLDDPCSPPENGLYFPTHPLPTFLHYCQFYRIGILGFQKRRIANNVFSCEAPMLVEPPPDLAQLDHKVKDDKKKYPLSRVQAKRSAFMVCTLHRSINAALMDYKHKMCAGEGANVNVQKTINLAVDWP